MAKQEPISDWPDWWARTEEMLAKLPPKFVKLYDKLTDACRLGPTCEEEEHRILWSAFNARAQEGHNNQEEE